MTRNLRTRRGFGFTLVELLVVVSVIAILSTLLLPMLVSAPVQARQVSCINNVKQLCVALMQYSNTYEGYLTSPAHRNDLTTKEQMNDAAYFVPGTVDGQEYKTWREKLSYQIGGETKVFICPAATLDRGATAATAHYGLNAYIAMWTNPERLFSNTDDTGTFKAIHVDALTDASRTFLIGENRDSHWVVKPKKANLDTDFAAVTEGQAGPGEVAGRHFRVTVGGRNERKCCWVFVDGHADAMAPTYSEFEPGKHPYQCFFWVLKDMDGNRQTEN